VSARPIQDRGCDAHLRRLSAGCSRKSCCSRLVALLQPELEPPAAQGGRLGAAGAGRAGPGRCRRLPGALPARRPRGDASARDSKRPRPGVAAVTDVSAFAERETLAASTPSPRTLVRPSLSEIAPRPEVYGAKGRPSGTDCGGPEPRNPGTRVRYGCAGVVAAREEAAGGMRLWRCRSKGVSDVRQTAPGPKAPRGDQRVPPCEGDVVPGPTAGECPPFSVENAFAGAAGRL
jgi:hypothetical protein